MVTKFLLLVGIDRFWRSVISDSVFLYLGRTLNSLHLNGKKLKQPHTSISRPSAFKNNQQWCDLTSRPNLRKLQNAPLLNISCLYFLRYFMCYLMFRSIIYFQSLLRKMQFLDFSFSTGIACSLQCTVFMQKFAVYASSNEFHRSDFLNH